MVNLWKRNMSITPTAGRAAPNKSGRWMRQALQQAFRDNHPPDQLRDIWFCKISMLDNPFSI